MEKEGYTNKRRVIEKGERERERKGWFEDHLPIQCSPLWFTSINIIGGWSSVLLYKIQQAYMLFNICYGQLLN